MLATYAEWVLPSSRNTPRCPPLPLELLSRIFRYYLQASTPYNPEETRSLGQICFPEHLLLVSKSWHHAASADSSLWREIILDPEIARVTPYKSLHSYTRVRSIRSRTQPLHVSINNDNCGVSRLAYLQAYHHLVTTMSRWERLFYHLDYPDSTSCITIDHLAAPTPNLREVVISSSLYALGNISQILPEAPNLKFLEFSLPGISHLPLSFCKYKSITIASIQIFDISACIYALSQLKYMHTLILRPCYPVGFWRILACLETRSFELPSVQTLILVGPLRTLQDRLEGIKFPALQTLEVDLTSPRVEKQWSKTGNGVRNQIKGLLTPGLQKLVLKSVWFDRWEDLVDILHHPKGWVGDLVCVDVTCTLPGGKGQAVEIDLGATLMQQGAVTSTPALYMLDGLLKERGIEMPDLMLRWVSIYSWNNIDSNDTNLEVKGRRVADHALKSRRCDSAT